jgi:hypothetical protein
MNTILWNNTASTGPQIQLDSGSPTVTYCNVQGGWPGLGNISSDPNFVDAANGDYHIHYNSQCRDAGNNAAPNIETEDNEGDPRIAYGTVDMGADEFYTHLYWTGNANPGGNVKFKFVGLPGMSPIQLWLGSGTMDPPMQTKHGDWHLQFPLLAHLMLGAIPSPDGVLILPFTFPPDTPVPLSLPFQAGIGTELTNLCVMDVE